MALYHIADIHGRYDLFKQIVEEGGILNRECKIDWEKDKVILTGDYVDRSPDSKYVLEIIQDWMKFHPGRIIALLGNHERMMIQLVEECSFLGQFKHKYDPFMGDTLSWWMANGGEETLNSYECRTRVPGMYGRTFHIWMNDDIKRDVEWLKTLPLYHEEPGFFFSHAPVPRENRRKPERQGKSFDMEELTWSYPRDGDEFGFAHRFEDKIGVCGHIHALKKGIKEPRFYDHYIYGDSGCGCHPDAPLAVINVETRQVWYAREK